ALSCCCCSCCASSNRPQKTSRLLASGAEPLTAASSLGSLLGCPPYTGAQVSNGARCGIRTLDVDVLVDDAQQQHESDVRVSEAPPHTTAALLILKEGEHEFKGVAAYAQAVLDAAQVARVLALLHQLRGVDGREAHQLYAVRHLVVLAVVVH